MTQVKEFLVLVKLKIDVMSVEGPRTVFKLAGLLRPGIIEVDPLALGTNVSIRYQKYLSIGIDEGIAVVSTVAVRHHGTLRVIPEGKIRKALIFDIGNHFIPFSHLLYKVMSGIHSMEESTRMTLKPSNSSGSQDSLKMCFYKFDLFFLISPSRFIYVFFT